MSVDLLREPTHKVLKKMALPISLGMLSTILFQVVDTYFVGTLGPEELTALGFASTLYFMLIGLYIGFSIGVSVIIGSFFGQDDLASVKRTSSIALLLSFVLSAVLSFVGFISLSHIYAFLGATPAQLVHISAYMKPVFAGLPFLSVAVAASGILRASGNVLFPEVVYGIAGVINVVLDYAFIFGKFGLPALGITGVAYGTVISWIFLLICMMVQFIRLQYFGNFITNWSHSIHITKLIFKLASPAVVTQLVGPFTLMFITYLLGNANTDAVAAFGVAGRIETLVMIGIMAVSTASTPFIAQNLGAKGIFIGNANDRAELVTTSWNAVYQYLKGKPRKALVKRVTRETDISVEVNLDGSGKSAVDTGVGFFDHMLEQVSRHGQIDLFITAKGDLEIDEHHTVEDVALTLGAAFKQALGSKKGIERYGFLLPMDDCLAQVAVDFGGRPWLVWQAEFNREKVGEMPTEMFMHFFKSFSDTALCNLNVKAEGANEHHKIEAIFKAFARALKMAVQKTGNNIPSTKGSL